MNLTKDILDVLDIMLDGNLISYKNYKNTKSKKYSDEKIKMLSEYADILLHSNSTFELANTYRKFINIL